MTFYVAAKSNTCISDLPIDYIEYEDAAAEFHPFVKFFATFDPKVRVAISARSNKHTVYCRSRSLKAHLIISMLHKIWTM